MPLMQTGQPACLAQLSPQDPLKQGHQAAPQDVSQVPAMVRQHLTGETAWSEHLSVPREARCGTEYAAPAMASTVRKLAVTSCLLSATHLPCSWSFPVFCLQSNWFFGARMQETRETSVIIV